MAPGLYKNYLRVFFIRINYSMYKNTYVYYNNIIRASITQFDIVIDPGKVFNKRFDN